MLRVCILTFLKSVVPEIKKVKQRNFIYDKQIYMFVRDTRRFFIQISRHCYWGAANIWHMLSTLDQSAVRSQLLWRASSVYTVIFEYSDIYSCCRAFSKLSLPVWTTKFVVNSARTPIFPMQGKRNTNWATTDIK